MQCSPPWTTSERNCAIFAPTTSAESPSKASSLYVLCPAASRQPFRLYTPVNTLFCGQDLLADCTWDQQAELVANTVNAPVCRRRGHLSRAYRSAFLRRCVAELELKSPDVHDDLYAALADTLVRSGGADNDDDAYAWKHFELWRAPQSADPMTTISIRQRLHCISDGTTGLHTWQAAGALAEWAIASAALLRGRRIVELGAGTGLTGLVVAAMCAPQRLTLTDGNARVCELLRSNVEVNRGGDGGDGTVRVLELDWERVAESGVLADAASRPDVILAADVVYDATLFGPLCTALDALFGDRSECCAYVAATVRNAVTLTQFLDRLGEYV